jgi:hypothetical protein
LNPKYLIIVFLLFSFHSQAQDVAALNASNISVTYDEAIRIYARLDSSHEKALLIKYGLTDCGKPLHLFVMSEDKLFDPVEIRKQKKLVLLINNGIHPGEPDGIDASIRIAQEYLSGSKKLPRNVIICIVPVFNIDGSLDRGCCSRANQNGPVEYGFRGNSKNLDLNRDFIKMDAENTRSLVKILREWDPDVFLDTHVSNGADYPYTMTMISTQHDKLGGQAGDFLKYEMTPSLFKLMKEAGEEMIPYVNTSKYDESPHTGIYGFMEGPRFASGYAAMFGCLAFVSETHMLKPFPKRVNATITLIDAIIKYSVTNSNRIYEARDNWREELFKKSWLPVSWATDSSRYELIDFKGYEAITRPSKVTGLPQLYYDTSKPWTQKIRHYDHAVVVDSVKVPKYYIVPQAWAEIIERMRINGVEMTRLATDSIIEGGFYRINDFTTVREPYEGHYLHSKITTNSINLKNQFYAGDYLINTDQPAKRYIVETLEPAAPDSWFAWGFFDAILHQKEWFSAYVFDPVAEEILEKDTSLREKFEKMKQQDAAFASNSFAQLYFIYRNSKYFEDTFKLYPVARIPW